MPVRVYKFERDVATDFLAPGQSVSPAASEALIAAINGQLTIRYEVLTEANNPRPIIAVIFADPFCRQHFDSLIEATLVLNGVRAREVRELEPHASLEVGRLRKVGSANDSQTGCVPHVA